MSGKVVKTVQWMLSSTEYPANSAINSKDFSIDDEGKVSKWNLSSAYLDLHSSGNTTLNVKNHSN